MYQNPLPPDHHIGTEGPNIEAAASDEENLSFPEIALLGDLTKLFYDLLQPGVAARWAFAITIIDTNMVCKAAASGYQTFLEI
jgi:hypothetical protein